MEGVILLEEHIATLVTFNCEPSFDIHSQLFAELNSYRGRANILPPSCGLSAEVIG